jgi:hypothetical protein
VHRLLLALAVVFIGSSAAARDVSGHLGIGGNYESGPLGAGLSVKYWVSDLGLHGFFGLDAVHSGDTAEEPGRLVFKPGVRVLYSMTRTRLANVFVGAGFSGTFGRGKVVLPPIEPLDEQGNPNPNDIVPFRGENFIDVVIGVEMFFGERFAVAGTMTFAFEIGDAGNARRSLGSGAWGASFHWYL